MVRGLKVVSAAVFAVSIGYALGATLALLWVAMETDKGHIGFD